MKPYLNIIRTTIGVGNLKFFYRIFLTLISLIVLYSFLFVEIQAKEGNETSWFTGFYWTLTTMTTLGYGDITFTTNLGRGFSILVLLTGLTMLVIALPVAFVEFIYRPWLDANSLRRIPKVISRGVKDHVIMTNYDEVTASLANRLRHYNNNFVFIVDNLEKALGLYDQGISVIYGDLDNSETYENANVSQASLVVASGKDTLNTSIAFTVRHITPDVPILATANSSDSVDILQLAGCNQVIELGQQMGQLLARLASSVDSMSHVLGTVDELMVADACILKTPLIGKTLREIRLREKTGVTVVGVWQRGKFQVIAPDTRLTERMTLVLIGTEEQITSYNELFAIYNISDPPIVIIGGGRVGRSVGATLSERGLNYRIIEQQPHRVADKNLYVQGNAADIKTMRKAGLMEAPTVIITSHEDEMNIYLTIYCRKLRPDIQIITRAKRERNIEALHRAGADFVMSYASMGSNIILNLLKRKDIVMITEGLNLFRVSLPKRLEGKSIADSQIYADTGCYITAIFSDKQTFVSPSPSTKLPYNSDILLIGTIDAENRYLEYYGEQ
tara:strand:+ start:41549 stop:43228 length:1680 start_codon:yes stop_codon:yes gene_type:complete